MAFKALPPLRIVQAVLWLLVLLAIAYLAASFLLGRTSSTPTASASLGPGVVFDQPFQMLDQHGNTVTEADFAGKPAAWFFGFTHCPDVCPTTLAEMAALREGLGKDADKIKMVFVTVDPERDTVPLMKEYIAYFDENIVGLVPTLPALEAFVKSRFVFYEKVPLEGDNYTMDHSAGTYLTDANSGFVGTLDGEEPFETRLAKLRNLINRARAGQVPYPPESSSS